MTHLNPKRARKAVSWLSVLTPLAAIMSLINVSISISTSVWLETTEQIFVDSSNITNPRSEVPRTKRTVSGLWLLCEYHNLTQVNGTVTHCFYIDYFAKERYTPEPQDSTMAIPYTVTKAGPIFMAGSLLLAIGILSTTLGYFWRRIRVVIFVAGVIVIVSGLIMFIGMVVYLSVLQAEVGQKLRPRNSMDSPLFVYHYGYSFILLAVGSMFTEITGTCITLWYIYWHQLDWAHKAGIHARVNSAQQPPNPRHAHNQHPANNPPGAKRPTSHKRQHSRDNHHRAPAQAHLLDDDAYYDARHPPPNHHRAPGGGGGAYYDRSGSSGEEYKNLASLDPQHIHHHRHRSSSHSGVQSMLVSPDSFPSYAAYNKLYPCKKHGTIPPRHSSHRHHPHPTLSPPTHPTTHRKNLLPLNPHCNAHFTNFGFGKPCGVESDSLISDGGCPLNSKCHKYSNGHAPCAHELDPGFCGGGYFDNDLLVDLDVPHPPPPPLPRDITCMTTVSGSEEFFPESHTHHPLTHAHSHPHPHSHPHSHPPSSVSVATNTNGHCNAFALPSMRDHAGIPRLQNQSQDVILNKNKIMIPREHPKTTPV